MNMKSALESIWNDNYARLDDEEPVQSSASTYHPSPNLVVWKIVCVLSIIFNVIQMIVLSSVFHHDSVSNQFLTGFQTDFKAATSAIDLEERIFDGYISFNKTAGDVYQVKSSETIYFGPPSDEIDAAWDNLLHGQYPALFDEEANQFNNIVTFHETGHAHLQLDMYHSLHCLNAIRKALYPDYYSKIMLRDIPMNITPSWREVHQNHCLDQLKQSIQCAGDLTPVPFYLLDGLPVAVGISGTHTCRRFDKIEEWQKERNAVLPFMPGE